MNQVRSVMEEMNNTLVKDGSVISISFVGATWPSSPPSTSSDPVTTSESRTSNDNAAIGAGVAAFVILTLGTVASILFSRKKPVKTEQKLSDSSDEIEQVPTFEDESTCSSGHTPQGSSITSMTFVKGTAKASGQVAKDGNNHDSVGNSILILNDAGKNSETTVNKKSFDNGDVVEELYEF